LSVSLSTLQFTDRKYEINLSASETGWTVQHYAPYQRGSEQLLKSSEVVRIYHQELEAFLKTDWEPLNDDPRLTVFLKERSRKRRIVSNHSSNAMWAVEMKELGQGGIINYGQDIRLKHIGSEKYLALKKVDDNDGYLLLSKEIDEENTLFTLQPVDKKGETNEIRMDEFFRIQHKSANFWLHGQEKEEKKNEYSNCG